MFTLHPRLSADCHYIGEFALCAVLLLNDARFPWFILVPKRPEIREIYALSEADQAQYFSESTAFSRAIMDAFEGEKLNIGALGNMVPQLHVHHIVRFSSDPAWPHPVWGFGEGKPYSESRLSECKQIITSLALEGYQPR